MDRGNIQAPVSGGYNYADRTYEPLKEGMEVGVPPRPQGVPITSTVVNVGVYQILPQDHIIWSIFNTVYMNFCCLGFMALVFSVKARDRKVVGDLNGAKSYGSTAKCLNITALVLTLLFFILIVILLATGVIAFASEMQRHIEQNKIYNFGSG